MLRGLLSTYILLNRLIFTVFFLLLATTVTVAQGDNLDWWDALHDYPNAAGKFRNRYQNISPGYMGPNALPVPLLFDGAIDNELWFHAGGEFHRAPGDRTNNFVLTANIPLAEGRVSLFLNSVPRETWEVTPEVRDLRRMVAFDGKGRNTGDIIFGFLFRIFDEEQNGFNLAGLAQAKSTTGSQIENARFSDASMFVWNIHFSKTLFQKAHIQFKIKAMLGFLTWQTNQNGLPNGSNELQNDAPSYGIGFTYKRGAFHVETDISGYHGYIGNRDYPTFWRSRAEYRWNGFGLNVNFGHGLKAWDWNTYGFGLRYYIKKKENKE